MNIIVVGCGRLGAKLAYRLYQKGHEVAVVDRVTEAFDNLPPDFRGHTLEAEVLNEDILHRAGIEKADGLASVTNSDTINAVVAHVARTVYHVPHVVARNYDPRFLSLHEAFGLQVVSSSTWGAQRIEELLSHPFVRTIFSAGNGEVEVYEFMVPDAWHGKNLQNLLPEGGCVAVALTRIGQAMLPSPGMNLEAGDVIQLSATLEGIQTLRKKLSHQPEG